MNENEVGVTLQLQLILFFLSQCIAGVFGLPWCAVVSGKYCVLNSVYSVDKDPNITQGL